MNNDIFFVPVENLFLHRDDVNMLSNKPDEGLEMLAANIKDNGITDPILVCRNPMLGQNEFHIFGGKRRWRAARMAGLKMIPCRLAPTITPANAEKHARVDRDVVDKHFAKHGHYDPNRQTLHGVAEWKWHELKGELDPVQWGRKAHQMLSTWMQLTPQILSDVCGIPRSVVLDRLTAYKNEQHFRAEAQVTKMNLETQINILQKKLSASMEEKVMASLGVSKPPHECIRCKVRYHGSTDGMCTTCQQRHREELEQGELVKCLEPGCKSWIKEQELPFKASGYFCKKHQMAGKHTRGISNMPLVDRDGDSIWITKDLEIIKVREMGDDHLTNSMITCIEASKQRCRITGVDEEKWEAKVSPRFAALKVEATRRDQHLKCPCVDGVVCVSEKLDEDGVTTIRSEVLCGQCSKGKDRLLVKEAAEKMAAETKKGRKMSLTMATIAIITLITAGTIPAGAHIVTWFIDYLRAMGAVK